MGGATYRDDYKSLEQAYMVLKDQYAELAVAIGASPMAMWGDPREKHDEIVAMAKATSGDGQKSGRNIKGASGVTHAELARSLSYMAKSIVRAQSILAEGMWNPIFCADECNNWAKNLCAELRDRVDEIEKHLAEQERYAR